MIDDWLWPGLLLLAVLGLWLLGAYNRVMTLRASILAAWTQVEGALQARAKLVAGLLTAVEPALASEPAALEAVSAAQLQLMAAIELVRPRPVRADEVAALARAELAMTGALARLLALVEQRATLRTEPAVATLLQALRDIGPRLDFARRVFNEAAATYNAAVQQMPTRLLRRLFDFGAAGSL